VSDKKYVVPEGGLEVAKQVLRDKFAFVERDNSTLGEYLKTSLEAFIRWQSENLIVPSHEQVIHLCEIFANRSVISYCDSVRAVAIEWLRIMYLAPEPEVPEEIKDLLLTEQSHKDVQPLKGELNSLIMEAYRRGKASK
jgi:hypothetical protein